MDNLFDYSVEDLEQISNPQPANEQDLQNLGIVQSEQSAPERNKIAETLDKAGFETPDPNKKYQKLSIPASIGDGIAAGLVEASHAITPKKHELQYESKTRVGETFKYLTRYGLGAASFAVGIGEAGTTIQIASKLDKLGKVANALDKTGKALKVAGSFAPLKAGTNAGKIQKAGVFLGNSALGGIIPSAMADFFLFEPNEEHHLSDMFGDTDNKLLKWLQTNEDDTVAKSKFKNMVEGLIVSPIAGVLGNTAIKTLDSVLLKNLDKAYKGGKKLISASTEQEAKEAITEIAQANFVNKQAANNTDIMVRLEEIRKNASQMVEAGESTTGNAYEEASMMLTKEFDVSEISKAKEMFELMEQGETLKFNDDGSVSIQVSKWQDAHKISPSEYKSQIYEQGSTPTVEMDKTVKDIWVERGWIGEQDELTKTNANHIMKRYKEKWDINSKVEVRFVDGLKGAQAKTDFSKKLNKIIITIDKHAKKPYSAFRSELEHMRDYAKNDYKNLPEGRHFSRYEGANEDEMAIGYIQKKSISRAGKALEENPQLKNKNMYNLETEQLKLNFDSVIEEFKTTAKTADEAVDDIINRKIRPKTTEDIHKLADAIKLPEKVYTEHTFKAVANDADEMAKAMNKAVELFGDDIDAHDTLLQTSDPQLVYKIIRHQMALNKVAGSLYDKIKKLPKDISVEDKQAVIDLYTQTMTQVKDLGSSAGMFLNIQKAVKKVVPFAENGLSTMQKLGIEKFTDILVKDVDETLTSFFTKGNDFSLTDLKQEILNKFTAKDEQWSALLRDKQFMSKLSPVLDEILKEAKFAGKLDHIKSLERFKQIALDSIYDDILNVTKLAPNNESMWNTAKNWFMEKAPLYYITNLLSSPVTVVKNVASGLANGGYFPLRKIIGGFLDGDKELTQEGINTYIGMQRNFAEAWALGYESFKTGEGKLVNVSSDTLNEAFKSNIKNLDDVFKNGNMFDVLHAIWSFSVRAMGASDEWMSQLNYRGIAYAKSLNAAQKEAANRGLEDVEYISKRAEEIFSKEVFTADGAPKDIDAFYETKKILYQNNLNGKIFDHNSGMMVQKENPSMIMDLGKNVQSFVKNAPLLKYVFPFIKTPTNILQMSIDHSLLAYLSPNTRSILSQGGKEASIAKAQIAMGNLSFMTATALAMNGVITGSLPADPKERSAFLKAGMKPYSIKVSYGGENHYVSYQGYEPIATILGTGADLVQLGHITFDTEVEDKISAIATQAGIIFANNFVDKAYFRTAIAQMNVAFNADNISPVELRNNLGNVAASAVLPGAIGVKSLSTLGRTDSKRPANMYETMFTGYFNRGMGEPRRNPFGESITVTNLLLAKSTNVGNEPEDKELRRLAASGYSPAEVSNTYTEAKLKFREFKDESTGQNAFDAIKEEMSTLTLGNKTLREAVRDLIMSNHYNMVPDGIGGNWKSSDDTKKNLLNEIFQEYIEEARNKIVNDGRFINKQGLSLNEAHVDFIKNKQLQSIRDGKYDIRSQLNEIF